MAYPALPDHRMPYDNDGTLVYFGNAGVGATTASTNTDRLNMQDESYSTQGGTTGPDYNGYSYIWLFFPEQREVTGFYAYTPSSDGATFVVHGSNDTGNGLDGTWETASLPGGGVFSKTNDHDWRSKIRAVSFTGPKKNVRVGFTHGASPFYNGGSYAFLHLYGEAAAGQMAHDLVFLDPDLGAGVAFPAPEDFGDQPLGTTVVRPFRVKNTSASRTATNVNIQCNDSDFVIGESSSGPWVVTINVASLAPGAETATLYIRCTTPAPGAALKPRFARILATCDSGFFG